MEKSLIELGEGLGAPLGHTTAHTNGNGNADLFQRYETAGAKFVNSAGYKQLFGNPTGTRPERWTTGPIEVGLETKGTLLEGGGAPGSGTGGGLVPAPQVVPGVVDTLFQPLSIEALMSHQMADTSTIRYAVEGTATSAAAGVAEGGTKPESTLALSTLDERIKKVATSSRQRRDARGRPGIQSYINGRLGLFIQIEVERQLIRGAAGGNEVQGLLTSRGVPVYAGGSVVGNYAVQLFAAMNGMRGSAFVEPEWVVMHPTDYQKLRLLTDTTGQFLGGGPFQGQYGNGGAISASGQVTGTTDTLWGKSVTVTPAMGGPGTALIGNSASACVWTRGGLSVEATNSHAGNFVLDLHRDPRRATTRPRGLPAGRVRRGQTLVNGLPALLLGRESGCGRAASGASAPQCS